MLSPCNNTNKWKILKKIVSCVIVFVLSISLVFGPSASYAQGIVLPSGAPVLPDVGAMVAVTPGFHPPVIRGIKVFVDDPLRFDFVIDSGEENLQGEALKAESQKLIKYFLTSLTVPDEEIWVNLSPDGKDRIIPDSFGVTEMGRDLLA